MSEQGRPLPDEYVQATAALRNAGCDPEKIRPESREMLIRHAAGEISDAEFEAYSERLVAEMKAKPASTSG